MSDNESQISGDIKPFLESYFATWSAGDIEGYKAHFHRQAVIVMVGYDEVSYAVIPGLKWVARVLVYITKTLSKILLKIGHPGIVLRHAMSRDEFMEQQTQIVTQSKITLVERMLSFTVEEEKVVAVVMAKWLLEYGDKTLTGMDRFTLIRDTDGNWKIIYLLWYIDK